MAFVRPSKNIVISREEPGGVAALFRPANQLRLLPARTANKAVSDQLAYLPGNEGLACMSGNGMGDNGLTSRAQLQRFNKKLNQMRMLQQAKLGELQAAGSPNGAPVPYVDLTMQQATRGMTFAANNPDADAGTVVATIPRNAFQSWSLVARPTGTGSTVVHAELWETAPDGTQQMTDQSPPMNDAVQAANYVQATEFNQGQGLAARTNPSFGSDLQSGANSQANSGSAAVRASQMVPWAPARNPRSWSNMAQGSDVNNTPGWSPGGVAGLGDDGDVNDSQGWQPGQATVVSSGDANDTTGWTPGTVMMPMTQANMSILSLTKVGGQPTYGSQPARTHRSGTNPFAGAPGATSGAIPSHIMAPAQKTWQIVTYSENNQIIYNAELVVGGPGGVRNTLRSSPNFTTMQDAANWIAANPVPGATIASQAATVTSSQTPAVVPWQYDPFLANPALPNQTGSTPGTNLSPFEVNRLQLDGLGDATTPAAAGTLFGFSTTTVLGVGAAALLAWYFLRKKKGGSSSSATLAGSHRTYARKRSSSSGSALKDDFLLSH